MQQNRLFVGNLSFNTGEEAIRDLFAQYGEVTKATLVTDRTTGRSRGFAFVEMTSDSDAAKAIDATHGSQLDGRSLRVSVAESKPAGGGNRDGRGRW
jgi:cold-inducible RNA-binding protein